MLIAKPISLTLSNQKSKSSSLQFAAFKEVTKHSISQLKNVERLKDTACKFYDNMNDELYKENKAIKGTLSYLLKDGFNFLAHSVIAGVFTSAHLAGGIASLGLSLGVTLPLHFAAHAIWEFAFSAVKGTSTHKKIAESLLNLNVPEKLVPLRDKVMTFIKTHEETLGGGLELQDGDKTIKPQEMGNTLADAKLLLNVLNELEKEFPDKFNRPLVQSHMEMVRKWVRIFEKMNGKTRLNEIDNQTRKEMLHTLHQMLRSPDPNSVDTARKITKELGLKPEMINRMRMMEVPNLEWLTQK